MVVGLLLCSICFLGSLVIMIPLTAMRISRKRTEEEIIQEQEGAFELRKPEWREPPPPYQEATPVSPQH